MTSVREPIDVFPLNGLPRVLERDEMALLSQATPSPMWTQDDYTPFELASADMDTINAQQKMLIPVAGAGHRATISHAQELQKFLLLERVRPLAMSH